MAGAISDKSITYISFGGTRRIRTADLYHVKADWPHRDTRGHAKANVQNIKRQATLVAGVGYRWTTLALEVCFRDSYYREHPVSSLCHEPFV